MTPRARRELERAWLGVLSDRHPNVRWTLVRPTKGGERDTAPAAGQIVGSLTAPEDQGALLDPNDPASAAGGPEKDGVNGS